MSFPENSESLTLPFNENWVDKFDNIESFRDEIRLIPSQRGNEGELETPKKPEISPIQAAMQDRPRETEQGKREVWDQNTRLQPTPTATPTPQPASAASPVYQPHQTALPTMVPVQTPNGIVMMPLAQTPAPSAPQTPVVEPGKGLDFRKLSESSPMIGANAPVNSAVMMQQMQSDPRMLQQMMYDQYMRMNQPISPGIPGQQPIMSQAPVGWNNAPGWGMMATAPQPPAYNPIWGNNVRPATPEELRQAQMANWPHGNPNQPWII